LKTLFVTILLLWLVHGYCIFQQQW